MNSMINLVVIAQSLSRARNRSRPCILAAIALLAPSLLCGQALKSHRGATLEGYVRDEAARPVTAASIYLRNQAGVIILQGQTGLDGSYKLMEVGNGIYTLRAEMGDMRTTSFGPFTVGVGQEKKIDLTLISVVGQASAGKSGVAAPQFDDEPKFTVSGVSEATSPGGHGSDAVLRTAETLTKQTASLGSAAGTDSSPAGSNRPARSPTGATEESALRETVSRSPADFGANHRLGTFLVDSGRSSEALPFLERASQANSDDFETLYELARAEANAGKDNRALATGRALLSWQNSSRNERAALHHLLGDVQERLGRPFEAVQDYQQAADLNPNEPNLFDWGSELLMHRALEPAAQVFTKGNHLFPQSRRMLIGLGVAKYARGFNDEATQRLCEASDLNPEDPDPYLFLGEMEILGNAHSGCRAEKLQRFARLQPNNALANYYSALTVDRVAGTPDSARNLARIQRLLEKAVALDPTLSAGYFQLGVLYSDQKNFASAIPALQRAVQSSPGLAEAHFRLARAYASTGETAKAQSEMDAYRLTSKAATEQADRERREIRRFVFTLRDQPPASQPSVPPR